MTDRELLELAAKAASIEITWENSHPFPERLEYFRGLPNYFPWNPLTDDGDALRLTVKLSLTVYQWADEVCACNEKGTVNEVVARIGDHYAATRRAIVRAAAEIGKSVK